MDAHAPMNEIAPATRPMLFYSVAILTAVVMAVIISPTPDAISVGLLALFTVPASVVIGIVARRCGRFSRIGKSNVILPAFIGILGGVLGPILINLAFRIMGR